MGVHSRMEKRHYGSKIIGVFIFGVLITLTVSCSNETSSLIEKGEANLLLGDYVRAERFFSAAVDKYPQSYRARIGLGKALLQRYAVQSGTTGGNASLITECLTQLEAARSIKPDTAIEKLLAIVWFNRANDLLKSCDTFAALAALSRSTSLDKTSSRPLNLAGILYFQRRDTDKALNLFRMVIDIDTVSATGYFNTGMVYWADSNYTQAYEFLFKAAQRAPEDRDILAWTARAKNFSGQTAK
jgi:tetratricopeptide (TPR) repeat protein